MNKVNFALVLWTQRPRPDNTIPIYIRITANRKVSYIATSYSIHPSFWDEKKQLVKDKHPGSGNINTDLQHKLSELRQIVTRANVEGKALTSNMIRAMFTDKADLANIFEFLEEYIKEVKSKRERGTIINYNKHFNILREYNKNGNLTFEEIDHRYLSKFETWLRENQKHGNNYVHTIFKDLKGVFNAARKRGVTDKYPFLQYEMPAYESPDKDYLTMEELKRWEQFADHAVNPVLKEAAVWLLFGCYSGLRVSDWYQFDEEKHLYNDVIRLRAAKNGEWVSMPVSVPLRRNLERMKYLPLRLKEPTINEKIKEIAKREDVAIKKHLTTHTGRHTFAVTICLGNKVSSETAAELMGITLKTFVDNYSQVTEEKIFRETMEAWAKLK